MSTQQSGLTLVELITGICIISLLLAIASPLFISVKSQAEISAIKHVLGVTRKALSLRAATEKVQGNNLQKLSYQGDTAALNPINDLLSEKPNSYIGITSNNPKLGDEGKWRDRTRGHLMIYTLLNNDAITTTEGREGGGYSVNDTKNVTYRIELVTPSEEDQNSDEFGLTLATPEDYQFSWGKLNK